MDSFKAMNASNPNVFASNGMNRYYVISIDLVHIFVLEDCGLGGVYRFYANVPPID